MPSEPTSVNVGVLRENPALMVFVWYPTISWLETPSANIPVAQSKKPRGGGLLFARGTCGASRRNVREAFCSLLGVYSPSAPAGVSSLHSLREIFAALLMPAGGRGLPLLPFV